MAKWIVSYTPTGDSPQAGQTLKMIVEADSEAEAAAKTNNLALAGWNPTYAPAAGPEPIKPPAPPPPAPAPTPPPITTPQQSMATLTGTSEGYGKETAPSIGAAQVSPAMTNAAMTGLRRARRLY